METPTCTPKINEDSRSTVRTETALLVAIAALVAAVHMLTNGRYGFHRDELQVLSDARHLDWGFVCYPPFTPFIERIGLALFGLSLVWLRVFSVLAQSIAIVFAGWTAYEFGGGRLAQIATALAIVFSPLPMFEGTEFQYSSFDYLWWVLLTYCLVRLLKRNDPRWWLGVGAAAGIGLQTKYTMAFLLCGVFGGLILTRARRYFLSGWFWAGASLGLAIFLPNLIWQVRHDFVSLAFLRHIHARDVGQGRANGFLLQQFWLCASLFAAPLWITGLICFFRDKKFRMLGWIYLIALALFLVGKGRSYYMAAIYPVMIAMGAAAAERWLASLKHWKQTALKFAYFSGLSMGGLLVSLILIPWTSSGRLKMAALQRNGDLREEIGWDELVEKVAKVRDSLPLEQRDHIGIVTGNYGEQGAIELFGPAYRLPPPISMTNSAWLRGYPDPPPTTMILVGFDEAQALEKFTDCRVVAQNTNRLGVKNEEAEAHPDIFLCGPPRLPWAEFWLQNRRFG